jgi:hypothetical protein
MHGQRNGPPRPKRGDPIPPNNDTLRAKTSAVIDVDHGDSIEHQSGISLGTYRTREVAVLANWAGWVRHQIADHESNDPYVMQHGIH